MSLAAGKLRVLIATTNGPVEVQLLTEEDAAIGCCVACIGGTTERADIAAAYHAFVVRPTGLIEQRFGHSCYRLDVSGRIDAGSSWQIGVLAAHALLACGRLAQESDVADAVLWATGSVRPVDLTVGAVSHVPEKLENSLGRFEAERAAGRPVLVAVPSANAAQVPASLVERLAALDIDLVAPSHAQDLFDALAVPLPTGARKGAALGTPSGTALVPTRAHDPAAVPALATATRRRYVWAAAIATLAVAIAATTAVVIVGRHDPSIEASRRAEAVSPETGAPLPPLLASPNKASEHARLDPDHVPFITEEDRERIRTEYLPAADYKALATNLLKMVFVSGQRSQAAADRGAIEACEKLGGRGRPSFQSSRVCDLYASGTTIVTRRISPPLPPLPWTNPAVVRPFDVSIIPMIDARKKPSPDSYPGYPRPKAMVISSRGSWYASYGQASPVDAMRRGLERCGYINSTACLVVAIDDNFVTAVPTLAKAVGFYRPEALAGAKPEARTAAAHRLAGATKGWNAVAVGAEGDIGTMVGAASERDAVNGAVEDCGRQDRDCHIAVIGLFLVEDSVGAARAGSR